MSEAVYDIVDVNGESEYEEPLGSTELHEHQYMELQQPEGVYDMARIAEPTFSDGSFRNCNEFHKPQYMQSQQADSSYDTFRVAGQIQQNKFDGTRINTESQYMELEQLEDVNHNERVLELEV